MGPLRSRNRERACAELIGEQPVEVTLAVAEPPSETAHPLTFDHAVGDQSHRARHDVLAHVPLRRSGRGVGPTPLARPIATLLGGSCGGKEVHVAPFRGDRRATRPAVDPGGPHRCEEPPVEAPVAALHGDIALISVERWHATIMPRQPDEAQRKSAVTIPTIVCAAIPVTRPTSNATQTWCLVSRRRRG